MVESDARRVARTLADVSRRFYARGWMLGTSGNLSAVVSTRPLRLAITSSGRDKRTLRYDGVVVVGDDARMIGRKRHARPSAETLLHVTIARVRQTRAVLHTHSVWGTILSDRHASAGSLTIEGYEMLKGLRGVASHEHRELVPILENDQDMPRLARTLEDALERHPDAHAVLLRRHGLYTWGDTLEEGERHVEIFEFLFETLGRTARLEAGIPHGGTSWR